MYRVRAAVLAALLSLSPLAASAESVSSGVLQAARESVVSVLPVWPGRPPDAAEPEGSGVVIGDGQWIVTAAHVLGQAQKVLVRDWQGNVMTATLGPANPATDIALLRIEEPMPALEWADEEPMPGMPVCALGNAFGLDLSITCGVVSAMGRSGAGFNAVEDFVQTDAAVNPGMSGGALVTADGKLAGLLSAIFTKQSDANIGVNFAVSSRLARRVTESLLTQGVFRPAAAGMTLRPAPARGETGQSGAAILRLVPDGAAERAGLRVDDTIVRAGTRRIRGPADMRAALALAEPGSPLPLEVLRDGEAMTVEIPIDAR